jgi:hypothetical protein
VYKKLFLALLASPLASFSQNIAPTDYTLNSAIVSANTEGYIQFKNNTAITIDQSSWDIALYNNTNEIGGKINDAKGVRLWRVYKDTTQFSAITLSDTLSRVYNSSSFMYNGAMDTIYTGSLATWFNIGLGRLSNTDYSVYATRMYIIQRADGSYGKFFLRKYLSRKYTIVSSDIDNLNPKTIDITKIVPITTHFQQINLSSGVVSTNFESAVSNWDLCLKRNYSSLAGSGTSVPLGILSNNAHNMLPYSKSLNAFADNIPAFYFTPIASTEIYQAAGDPVSVTYNGSLNNTTTVISYLNNQIGASWYNPATQKPQSGVSYFIRDQSKNIWHVIFTNYDIVTNELNYAFRKVGTARTNDFIAKNNYSIFIEEQTWRIESARSSDINKIAIYNLSGALMHSDKFKKEYILNTTQYPKGIYILLIEADSKMESIKISI